MPAVKDRGERVVRKYIEEFVKNSRPVAVLKEHLDKVGIGLYPVVDHITVRTMDVDRRAREFLRLGYKWDRTLGVDGILQYDDWWAKVYRKPGLPALFVDQPFKGPRGNTSVITPWVKRFSDRVLHHIAVRVEEIERAVSMMKKRGIRFAGPIVGARGTDLRQIFTAAGVKRGHPFTVVEIIERHRGYAGFSPPSADALMKSSVVTAKRR